MHTTIHRKSLPGFLALFGNTYADKGASLNPSGSTLYAADSPDPPMTFGNDAVPSRPMEVGDFDEQIHREILDMVRQPHVIGLVMFENLAMDSPNLGARTAVMVGGEMFKTVADCQGKRLGDVPSRFQYPLAAYVKGDEHWDEKAINGQKFEATLEVEQDRLAGLRKLCQDGSACEDLGKDEVPFDEEVKFPNGMRMAVQVCSALRSHLEPREPCWTQGVLFDPNGNELGCTDCGESVEGEFCVSHGIDDYVVTVKEIKSDRVTTGESA